VDGRKLRHPLVEVECLGVLNVVEVWIPEQMAVANHESSSLAFFNILE
jgi:hypothetical protein